MFPIHTTKASIFNYDDIPAGYYFKVMNGGSKIQRFWHQNKFAEVAASVKDGQSLLDIGCGPGSFMYVLDQKKKPELAIGVDVSSRQIQFAIEEVSPLLTKGRFSFISFNPSENRLPFEDHSFDLVTFIEVIEHIHPHLGMQILIEAKRVLKPGGRLIVSTPNYRSLWPLIEIVLEKLSPIKYHDQHISKFTPNAMVKFLESAGFDILTLKTIFLFAPFLSPISERLALNALKLERQTSLLPGAIMIAECKPVFLI